MLSQADHRKIDQAVRTAEARTSGEIVCILADEVSNYREVPLAIAAGVALLAPLVALMLGHHPWLGWPGSSDWITSQTDAVNAAINGALQGYGLFQVVLFAVVAGVVAWPPLRRILTPGTLKQHRVHRAAMQQFLATGLHANPGRTGVVIFAAQKDRRVELLADDAIHAAVGDIAWNAAVKAVQDGMRRNDPTAGFIQAVDICGDALAAHFPAGVAHADTRSDHVIEL
ncbi:MAG: TPM domain-containing protein [Caulobacteraceae bacterium]